MTFNTHTDKSSLQEKKLAILGSTGSIGTQTVEIVKNKPGLFRVTALSAHNNYKLLAEQANSLKPEHLALTADQNRKEFESLLTYNPESIRYGHPALEEIASETDYDQLLNSLVGFAGFMSTFSALKRGKRVALANKESLVVGGELITGTQAFKDGKLLPVDSEHSAMFQCLAGENRKNIRKIVITASGGPFKDFSKKQLEAVTVEDALRHPNWDMGAKITIDSSTMMNKGLEIIEARWFFDLPVEKIEPVIHPQSIIHSIIEFVDGSSKAQLGPPDMKVPILYALSYPGRIVYPNPTLNYSEQINMEFFPVDYGKFPCLKLATDAVKEGGFATAVLNAANEIAVERFLDKEIRYIDIPEIIETSLSKISSDKDFVPSAIKEIDEETRNFAKSLLN